MGAAGGIAAGVGAAGSIYSALAMDAAATYNSVMAEYDAKQLDSMASEAIARGEEEATRVGQEGRRLFGEQRAILAAQGIDVSTGTAADMQLDTIRRNAEDLSRVRANAAREALGIRTQASSTRAQSANATAAARAQAGGTLLTGAAQAISAGGQLYESNNRGAGSLPSGGRSGGGGGDEYGADPSGG